MTGAPAKMPTSQLRKNDQWQELAADEYQLDQERRTVLVRVMPGEALRVIRIGDYDWRGEDDYAELFHIEEITVVGGSGELKLTGHQARTIFSKVEETLYTLTYK